MIGLGRKIAELVNANKYQTMLAGVGASNLELIRISAPRRQFLGKR